MPEDILSSRQVSWPVAPNDASDDQREYYMHLARVSDLEHRRTFDTFKNIWRYLPTVTTVTAAYTANDFSVILVDASAAARTITLPTAVAQQDRVYWIKKIDTDTSNAVTVEGSGSENIDGSANLAITASYGNIVIISNGTQWYTLNIHTSQV